jgi:hypothetical protein
MQRVKLWAALLKSEQIRVLVRGAVYVQVRIHNEEDDKLDDSQFHYSNSARRNGRLGDTQVEERKKERKREMKNIKTRIYYIMLLWTT